MGLTLFLIASDDQAVDAPYVWRGKSGQTVQDFAREKEFEEEEIVCRIHIDGPAAIALNKLSIISDQVEETIKEIAHKFYKVGRMGWGEKEVKSSA